MKRLLTTLSLLCLLLPLCAQYRSENMSLLGVSAEYKKPMGDFGDIVKNGMGINVVGKYLVNPVIGIGFEAGYHNFKADAGNTNNISQERKYNLIPLLLEGTFYIPNWDRTLLPYLGVHFGGNLLNVKIEQSSIDYESRNISKSINRFVIGGGLHAGVLLEMSEFFSLDIKLKYDYIPGIDDKYEIDDYNSGLLGFDKITDVGISLGLLYRF
ncbi:MAG: porin family protein [Culturomica sp.]|jgi:hypothetical protein|nr:porin family protein [Culturomica sp.]